jgi:hypothetical protein
LKSSASAPPVPVQGPVLVDGGFSADPDKPALTVDFDREVSVAGFVPASLIVNDPGSGTLYRATSAGVFGGITVVFSVEAIGSSSGSQTWMSASAGNGIVSSDDGTPWAGVSELGLPFP